MNRKLSLIFATDLNSNERIHLVNKDNEVLTRHFSINDCLMSCSEKHDVKDFSLYRNFKNLKNITTYNNVVIPFIGPNRYIDIAKPHITTDNHKDNTYYKDTFDFTVITNNIDYEINDGILSFMFNNKNISIELVNPKTYFGNTDFPGYIELHLTNTKLFIKGHIIDRYYYITSYKESK